jgi:hypothetical protein
VGKEDRGLEKRARAIIKQIDSLLTDLTDLLKSCMDPIDEWELERDAFEIVETLSSWVEAVMRSGGDK